MDESGEDGPRRRTYNLFDDDVEAVRWMARAQGWNQSRLLRFLIRWCKAHFQQVREEDMPAERDAEQ